MHLNSKIDPTWQENHRFFLCVFYVEIKTLKVQVINIYSLYIYLPSETIIDKECCAIYNSI